MCGGCVASGLPRCFLPLRFFSAFGSSTTLTPSCTFCCAFHLMCVARVCVCVSMRVFMLLVSPLVNLAATRFLSPTLCLVSCVLCMQLQRQEVEIVARPRGSKAVRGAWPHSQVQNSECSF